MKVMEHTPAAYAAYVVGEADGTISLWRRMSVAEADICFAHQVLQGGAIKWVSESFIKAATFGNAAAVGPQRLLEFRITLATWVTLNGLAVPQHGAAGGAIQFTHEGLYRMDTTQGGPFKNYGIPPAWNGAFNAGLQAVNLGTPYVYPKA